MSDDFDRRLGDLLRLGDEPVDLAGTEPGSTPGFDGDKSDGKDALAGMGDELNDLSRRLFAAGNHGAADRILVVLQGMDTSGKGGVVRHVAPLLDPQTWSLATFGRPTEEERGHDFLWRIKRGLPSVGQIGFFDRSHYEDVLVPVVDGEIDGKEHDRRLKAINRFEESLVDDGVVVLKCYLHITAETQKERLIARLDKPEKHWKYDPHDLEDRSEWADYQAAYLRLLTECASADAPWHVVPADRKWYRNLAVARLLLEHLRDIDPQWPVADFDVDKQRDLLTT
ncbi:hypothetical protein BH20ACT6_BH20ACT6_10170 [soil metagenome]